MNTNTLESPTNAAPAIQIPEGVDYDPVTGLMWTRDDLPGGRMQYAAFERAVADCRVGGFDDWSAPERGELETILKLTTFDPCVDRERFPTCKSAAYWSRTECAFDKAYVWVVNFNNGYVFDYHRGYGGAFGRAVRRVSSSQ